MAIQGASRSITAKLAYLMTFVVTLTVVSLTVQSASKFSAYILQTIEESTNVMAERSAADVASIIEGWVGQISVTTSKMSAAKSDANGDDLELKGALRAEKDLLAMRLYLVDGANYKMLRQAKQQPNKEVSLNLTPAFFDTTLHAMDEVAASLAKEHSLFESDRYVRNVTAKTKTPMVMLAVRFTIPGQKTKFAMMVTAANMTKIQISLPQSRSTTGYMITSDGKLFASTDEQIMLTSKSLDKNDLVKKALQRQAPSGFLAEFIAAGNKTKLGSFAQTPGSVRLYTIVERDREAAFQIIARTYLRSALWGSLILLVAAMASFVSASGITRNLRDMVGATRKIASGDFAVRLQPSSRDEIAELGHSVNHMASKIQMLMSHEIEKARFEKELETARMVQSTFFPKKDVVRTHLAVTGNYQPATECGGDLWGHYTVSDGVELVYIADAMGHGAPAALVTAIAYAVCQSVSIFLADNTTLDPSPATLLRRLNTIIMDAVDGKISMTFFVAVFDFNTGKITYSNAGHNFPVILTGNKSDERLGRAAKKINTKLPTASITLNLQGNPLGVDKEITYSEKSIDFFPGDKIFLFTDGLIENQFVDKDPLGRKVLLEFISSWGDQNIIEIKNKTLELGKQYFGSENLQDDVTIVVAEVSKAWVKPVRTEDPELPAPPVISHTPQIPTPPVMATQEAVLDLGLTDQVVPVFDLGFADEPAKADEGSQVIEGDKKIVPAV